MVLSQAHRLKQVQREIQLGLRSACKCSEKLAANCYLRSYGMAIVDINNNIKHADPEAVSALRGPAEGWRDDELVSLRDGSCAGAVEDHWSVIERLSVGSGDEADGHHYLVVQRSEDAAVCWIQVCIHYLPAVDGQPLYAWYMRDISCSARCLESFGITTKEEYTLSLEDDGFPFSTLLTQALPEDHGDDELGQQPVVTHASPAEQQSRDQLAGLLESAVLAETFAVLYLTGFGAIDSVFPRRLLGWAESDLLDRSFIGLLSPEDRTFFCRVLRRCSHDGIPQRLIVKMACAPGFIASSFFKGNSDDIGNSQKQIEAFVDCDVTVLVPESVQQPVLIVRATDQQRPRQADCADAKAMSTATPLPPGLQQPSLERHSVQRVQLLGDACARPSNDLPSVSTAAIASPARLTDSVGSGQFFFGPRNDQLPLHMDGACGKDNNASEEASLPLNRCLSQSQQQNAQSLLASLASEERAPLLLSSFHSIQPHSVSRSEASSFLSEDESPLLFTPPITSLEGSFPHGAFRPQSAEMETATTRPSSVMGSRHIGALTIQACSTPAEMAGAQTVSAVQPPPLSGLRRTAASQGLDAGTLCEKAPAEMCVFSRSFGSLGSEPAVDWSQKNLTLYEKASAGSAAGSLSGKQASELRSGAQLDISMSDIFACLHEHPASTRASGTHKGPEELNGSFRHAKTLVVDGAFDSMLDRLNIGAIRNMPH